MVLGRWLSSFICTGFCIKAFVNLLLAPILHAGAGSLRLSATGTWQTISMYQLYFWSVACHGLDRFGHLMTQGIGAFCIIEYRSILHLDLEIEGIQAILLIDDDAEVRARFGEPHQGCFNLAGEDDQSTNRDRIVTASLDCRDFWMRSTTGAAIFPPGTRKITTAIHPSP